MKKPDFHGVKIALVTKNNQVAVLLRDNKPGLRFAGMWDLPGGGRGGDESPVECVQREVREELGIDIPAKSIQLQKLYPSMHSPATAAYFMIAPLSQSQLENITFGGEGQKWQLMPVDEFISHKNAVPDLQDRLQENYTTDV